MKPHPKKPKEISKTRTLAMALFKAHNARKRKHPPGIWGDFREWKDMPSETVEVWIAVAACAYRRLK